MFECTQHTYMYILMLLALNSCHSSYSFNGDRLSAVFLAYFPLTSYHFTFVFLTAVKLIIIIIIIIIIMSL